jgi:hypothetical protein
MRRTYGSIGCVGNSPQSCAAVDTAHGEQNALAGRTAEFHSH